MQIKKVYLVGTDLELQQQNWPSGIKIAVEHWTSFNKKCYMSGTHISEPDILSCTLSWNLICGNSLS